MESESESEDLLRVVVVVVVGSGDGVANRGESRSGTGRPGAPSRPNSSSSTRSSSDWKEREYGVKRERISRNEREIRALIVIVSLYLFYVGGSQSPGRERGEDGGEMQRDWNFNFARRLPS